MPSAREAMDEELKPKSTLWSWFMIGGILLVGARLAYLNGYEAAVQDIEAIQCIKGD